MKDKCRVILTAWHFKSLTPACLVCQILKISRILTGSVPTGLLWKDDLVCLIPWDLFSLIRQPLKCRAVPSYGNTSYARNLSNGRPRYLRAKLLAQIPGRIWIFYEPGKIGSVRGWSFTAFLVLEAFDLDVLEHPAWWAAMPFARLLGKLKVTRLACGMDEGEAVGKKRLYGIRDFDKQVLYLSIWISGMPHNLRNL